ncbi:MAG: hypothetical protein GYB52_20780 [Rhodospirillales bacterium]|nr:hypothetical protein [Rhodospirillales bacterium]MBR9819065.1 hypothetical protein [Rhodospirillales bacterium]
MAGILALIAALGMIIGIVTMIKPIAKIKIPTRLRALQVFVVSIILGSIAGALAPDTKHNTASNTSPVLAASDTEAPEASNQIVLPDDELLLIQIVNTAKSAYSDAANDMAKGGVRAQRRADICQNLPSLQVNGWIGRITELGSNSEGKGVLSVEIHDNITVGTWNNALSDINSNTLIDPTSDLFQQAVALSDGDLVEFSGSFQNGDADCLAEKSMSQAGSINDPEFTFRFKSIRKL